MTNTPHEPEEQRPKKRVRLILVREVCTSPEETAKRTHRAIQEAIADLRTHEPASDYHERWQGLSGCSWQADDSASPTSSRARRA